MKKLMLCSILSILFFTSFAQDTTCTFFNDDQVYEFNYYTSKIIHEEKQLTRYYDIKVKDNNKAIIEMTLTSPNCPVAESLPKMVKDNILKIEGIDDVELKLVWEPPWDKDKMSEAAKLELNL